MVIWYYGHKDYIFLFLNWGATVNLSTSSLLRKCQSCLILARILFIWKQPLRFVNCKNLWFFFAKPRFHLGCFILWLVSIFVNATLNDQIQLKSLAEEMQAVTKGLEKVEQELAASDNDGAISSGFHKVRHDNTFLLIFFYVLGITR